MPQKNFHDGEQLCEPVFGWCPPLADTSNTSTFSHDHVRGKLESPRESPRQSHGMDDWVFDAVAGRNITMLVKSAAATGTANGRPGANCKLSKTSSILYLNLSLSLMTIQPINLTNFTDCPTITIEIDSIKAISSV